MLSNREVNSESGSEHRLWMMWTAVGRHKTTSNVYCADCSRSSIDQKITVQCRCLCVCGKGVMESALGLGTGTGPFSLNNSARIGFAFLLPVPQPYLSACPAPAPWPPALMFVTNRSRVNEHIVPHSNITLLWFYWVGFSIFTLANTYHCMCDCVLSPNVRDRFVYFKCKDSVCCF